jgi:ERI1 exoribonuclease 3
VTFGAAVVTTAPVTSFTHLVVLDFEATCDGDTPPEPQEIIEFPSVLLRLEDREVTGEFESFVRPLHHPELTPFCTELTSITTEQVADAPLFPEVFAAHQEWLASHGLPLEPDQSGDLPYALVTCGDWDLQTMLPRQLRATEPPIDFMPHPYRRWINVKVPFRKAMPKLRRAGMARMLEALDLELEGRHHRGIDDTRNITKIVRALIARHQPMTITGELPASRYPTIEVVLERWGERVPVELPKRALPTLLGIAGGAFHKQAQQVFDGDRELTEDADLYDLRSGAVLRIA